MTQDLIDIITSPDPAVRDRALDAFCRKATGEELLAACDALDRFWRDEENLYQRVRALFFLYAIYRFHLPTRPGTNQRGRIPFEGYTFLLKRRFEEAIDSFRAERKKNGPSATISSALAASYHNLAFQTLADQVRRSVRSVKGNQWMFRIGHPADQPLRIRRELIPEGTAPFPVLHERTPVRMDLSHSAWSDIFFLGMDFPEGARVLNVSIDLAVRGRDDRPQPPVNAFLRVLDEPVLRLSSVDLGVSSDITRLADVFDYAKDYLGLLKAAVIASGIVPPGMEGSGQSLGDLLTALVGPGRGLELVSHVNDIPKGSRLAVSTNLLAGLISACMRATGQVSNLSGPLTEDERRLIAARAILGEWLAGSGGGWQDSGGLWPGMKLIEGVAASEGDPEFGISRGCLLPRHRILDSDDASPRIREALQDSLVLVHGGMAQNVGPILEMVTEKYLLRSEAEWAGRKEAMEVMDDILSALRAEDVRRIGEVTTHNFMNPIQTIIPWASNFYTERLIDLVRKQYTDDFWGFWMLGGMSGGGMGFIFDPKQTESAKDTLMEVMQKTKDTYQYALPFAMDPVVYDFAINESGSTARLLEDDKALMPSAYYAMMVPDWVRLDPRDLTPARRRELDQFGAKNRTRAGFSTMVETLFDNLFPDPDDGPGGKNGLQDLLKELGFDREQQESIRDNLRSGTLGLSQNRLPATTRITDVPEGEVIDTQRDLVADDEAAGKQALAEGRLAVVTLAAGTGSRWTQGAGVVKALHPFCRQGGSFRNFIEVHLAKNRTIGKAFGATLPQVFTTSYLTHEPIRSALEQENEYGHPGKVLLSPGRVVGVRMVPMVRDLRFSYEEMPQQLLDEQAQKVRESLHNALIGWARETGEGTDYTDNLPQQCLHPVGHWFEVPNLLRNGVLKQLLEEQPNLQTLLLHNIDTVGANADPALFGRHLRSGKCLTYEVIPRSIEDLGGGLAQVNGRTQLVEGLALPNEEIEFDLSYYNTLTTWIDIEKLLAVFELTKDDLDNETKVTAQIRKTGGRLPTYITLKEVKKRWGHGQEDVFPVSQYEKLWGDMTTLPEVDCGFFAVSRLRGQQLKDQAQLDGWLRDGSAAYVEGLCQY